jgi:pyrroline-5-carboxylate reductase
LNPLKKENLSMNPRIAFIGGGNMASAIIGGLIRQGTLAQDIDVVEPFEAARAALRQTHGVEAQAQAGEFLSQASLVVWAVKPQTFRAAASAVQAFTRDALHLSVAAGIPSSSIASWVGSERVVRAMPNTPALIGRGMTALFARAAVTDDDRARVSQVIATTGELMWLDAEEQLDAVTALSGSGPAYVFYFLEAMRAAGADMGLSAEQAYQLAVATFIGAGELARASSEPPEVLRQRVTSPGGTTHAAITTMEQHQIKAHFMQALQAARHRAAELGQEFGAA